MNNSRLFNVRWFALVFASLIVGIAFSVNLVAGIVLFFALLIALIVCAIRRKGWKVALVVLIVFSIGFGYASGLNLSNNARSDLEDINYMTAKISIDSKHDADGNVSGMVVLEDISYGEEDIDGKATAFIRYGDVALHVGDIISFHGNGSAVKLDIKDIGDTSLYVRGVHYFIEGEGVKIVRENKLGFRDRLVMKAEKVLFERLDSDTAGFMAGMIFGDNAVIGGNIKAAARRLGISHLFAVSGLHVGMIVSFLVFLMNKARINRRYHIAILPFLLFYAYICDFSVSIVRATIMVTIFLMSNVLFLRYDMLSSLSFAGIVILLVNPMFLFDVSFIMSFLAVLSIALFAKRITRFLVSKSEKWMRVKGVLGVNLSVNIGLLPIMLYLFGGMSLVAIPVNLVLIPIVTIIFPIFFLVFIFAMLTHLYFLVPIIGLPFMGITMLSKAVASLNFAGINFDVSTLFVPTYIIVMILCSELVFIKKSIKRLPYILLVIVVGLSLIMPPITSAVLGDKVDGMVYKKGYIAMLKDVQGRDVLVVQGGLNPEILDRAISLMSNNRCGHADVLIVPSMRDSEVELVEYYNKSIGADIVMTNLDLDIGDASVVRDIEGITLKPTNDIVVENEDVRYALLSPHTKMTPYDVYDAVIGQNIHLDVSNIAPKYYINFAKDSQGESASDFTFYTKNGRINLSDIR